MTGARRAWMVAIIVAAGLAVIVVAQLGDARGWLASAVEALAGLGRWGLPLFVALYVAATVLLLPAVVLTLGGGAAFGLARGALAVWVGATLGAAAAFLIGRYLARAWVERRLARHPRFRAIDDAVAREGWKIVLLTRLSPAFPFVLLNYAFGLTKIKPSHYVVTSFFAMLPGAAAYSFIGYAGRESAAGGEGLVLKVGAALGLLVFIAMLPRFVKRLQGQQA